MLQGEGRKEVLPPVGDHALYIQANVQAWVGVGGVGAEMCEGGYQQWVRDICSLINLGGGDRENYVSTFPYVI